MVFTLVSAGQEWLSDKWDCVKREREEKVLAKLKADEEAEQVYQWILRFLKLKNLNTFTAGIAQGTGWILKCMQLCKI